MEEILKETNQEEKVDDKVGKSKKSKQSNIVKCDVLKYNAKTNKMIISFNDFGYELDAKENPGSSVNVKVTGKIGNQNFKLTVV